MAYTPGNLSRQCGGNGYSIYRYDTLDQIDVVEAAGYFNNRTQILNLGKGDIIFVFRWTTAVRTGILSEAKPLVVTNTIPDVAGSGGQVNSAEIWITTGISSLG